MKTERGTCTTTGTSGEAWTRGTSGCNASNPSGASQRVRARWHRTLLCVPVLGDRVGASMHVEEHSHPLPALRLGHPVLDARERAARQRICELGPHGEVPDVDAVRRHCCHGSGCRRRQGDFLIYAEYFNNSLLLYFMKISLPCCPLKNAER